MTVKKNLRTQHNVVKSLRDNHEDMKKEISKVKSLVQELLGVVKDFKFSANYVSPQMKYFFPCDSDEKMQSFLSNEDGKLEEKVMEFEKYLYNAINGKKSQSGAKNFIDNLLHQLFTREYIVSHRWPHTRY